MKYYFISYYFILLLCLVNNITEKILYSEYLIVDINTKFKQKETSDL
jgi:hypothetical protein